jgi:hypothetical protein
MVSFLRVTVSSRQFAPVVGAVILGAHPLAEGLPAPGMTAPTESDTNSSESVSHNNHSRLNTVISGPTPVVGADSEGLWACGVSVLPAPRRPAPSPPIGRGLACDG